MTMTDKEKNTAVLRASKSFDVRFSEVDSMQVVWHGSYALYFEDAREAFGAKYDLGYMLISDNGYFAPLVDLSYQFRRPVTYGQKCRIDIFYRPTAAAKIIFDYEIRDEETDELLTTGRSVQVFMDKNYNLVLYDPPFYAEWKKRWLGTDNQLELL